MDCGGQGIGDSGFGCRLQRRQSGDRRAPVDCSPAAYGRLAETNLSANRGAVHAQFFNRALEFFGSIIWVYRDAEARGKTGCLWLLIIFFTWPFGLIAYFLLRDQDVKL